MKHQKHYTSPLNFVLYAAPPTKQASASGRLYGLTLTFLSIALVVSIICLVQARQVLAFYTIRQEHTTLKKYLEDQKQKITHKKALNKKHTALQEKLKQLTTHYRALLTLLLKELAEAIPDNTRIDKLETDFKQKTVTLTGQALNSEGVTTFVRTLSNRPFIKTVTLTNVHKHPHHFYCSFNLQALF